MDSPQFFVIGHQNQFKGVDNLVKVMVEGRLYEVRKVTPFQITLDAENTVAETRDYKFIQNGGKLTTRRGQREVIPLNQLLLAVQAGIKPGMSKERVLYIPTKVNLDLAGIQEPA